MDLKEHKPRGRPEVHPNLQKTNRVAVAFDAWSWGQIQRMCSYKEIEAGKLIRMITMEYIANHSAELAIGEEKLAARIKLAKKGTKQKSPAKKSPKKKAE